MNESPFRDHSGSDVCPLSRVSARFRGPFTFAGGISRVRFCVVVDRLAIAFNGFEGSMGSMFSATAYKTSSDNRHSSAVVLANGSTGISQKSAGAEI